MAEPKFMWMEGSRWIGHQFWATVIIYNIPDGIGKVEQKMPDSMGGNWCAPSTTFDTAHVPLCDNLKSRVVCVQHSITW